MFDSSNMSTARKTAASSSSLDSSPLTPDVDSQPSEPAFTDFGQQSTTLDSIGAWSSVRPDPTAFSASSMHSYDPAKDIHQLGKDYSALSLGQHATSQSESADATAGANGAVGKNPKAGASNNVNVDASAGAGAGANAGASIGAVADPDYSELDEAILRGRSTTLPNIFTAPNSLYRYTAFGGAEKSAPAGPVSPASTSNYSMLSRHGSISVTNSNSNRTVSPLGLSLNANPIHQTASLDNHLASPLEQPSAAAAQSRLDLLSGASGMPVRRFSEFNVDAGSSLSLASYSMGPLFAGGMAHSSVANDSSSAAFGSVGRPTQASSVQPASTAAPSASGASAMAANRYGSFGYQLPTMREEDAPASHASPPALADSVLMQTMSFSGASAASASLQFFDQHHAASGNGGSAASGSGHLFASRIPSASPVYGQRQGNFDASAGMAPGAYGAEKDGPAGSSYLPLRVKSLRDLRRPSLDVRSEHAHDAGAIDSQAVNSLFERNAGFQHSLSFNHLSSMAGLHRRHSLAITNPHMPTPANSVASGNGRIDGDMYSMQISEAANNPSSMFHPGGPADSMAYHHQHYIAAGAYDPNAGHLQRQGSTPALSVSMSQQHQQQQQQQFAMYHQYTGPIPIGRIASVGPMSSGGHAQYSAATASGVRPGAYYGLGSQVQSQQIASAHMQPQLMRPMPASHSIHMQQQQQQHVSNPPQPQSQSQSQSQSQASSAALSSQALHQSHHMRRASHPALPSLGIAAANIPLISPTPVVLPGSHSSSHTLMPNPATTITPNMPFADMGKGLPYQSLPKGTRVFVVQFKGRRCDLFFAPNKDMKPKVIPALAPSALAIPASAAASAAAGGSSSAAQQDAVSVPADGVYEPGVHVLVEADRGVDLGVIKEELLSLDAIVAFSNALAENGTGGGAGGANDQAGSEGRRSVAPADAEGSWSQPLAMVNTSASTNASEGAGSEQQSASTSSSAKDVYVKRIFRVADQREVADLMSNKVFDEQKALSMCQSKVQQRKLSMCVVDAEFQFDRRKLTFYFTAGRRVDFRELVRELFKHFKTRIWMCQQTN
ncbi:hypothetical protein LPJ75_000921 [Coemansia sp. RSA 2598]|nr:hypothetical protein LPJ75_000921 [Coemansia sp. RSA 2598]